MLKLLTTILLVLTTSSAIADNVFIYEDKGQNPSNRVAVNNYIYKSKGGQILLTNTNPSGNFDKFTKKVKVTYYRDSKNYGENKSNKKQADSKEQNVSYGSSSNSNSSSYANSAYLALR